MVVGLMLTAKLASWTTRVWASVQGALTCLAKAALPVLWKPASAIAVVDSLGTA